MTLKAKLLALARAVADEAEHNAPFRKTLQDILNPKDRAPAKGRVKDAPRHRRAPAKVDPVQLTREGRDLRDVLRDLDIEELKDVVAEFGMDPSKLVMKWKDRDRIAEHIVDTSMTRAAKGTVFRS